MSQSYWLFYLCSTNVKTGCISAGARMGTPRKHMVPEVSGENAGVTKCRCRHFLQLNVAAFSPG